MLAFLLVYAPGSGVGGRGEGKRSEELSTSSSIIPRMLTGASRHTEYIF